MSCKAITDTKNFRLSPLNNKLFRIFAPMKQAMLLAAGLGTRLRPLTSTMPKALVPVAGRPLLYHVIQRLQAAGFQRIVVNIHHFGQQIIDYLESNHNFGMDIRISDERDLLLETGGALKHAAHLFEPEYPILIHNVDILSNVDLQKMWQQATPRTSVLLVSDRQTKRYLLFDEQRKLAGWTNVETGDVKSPYEHFDPQQCQRLAFDGIHLFSPALFPLMESWPEKFSIIDFYLQACARFPILAWEQEGLQMMDVGKTDTLAEAEQFLATLS